MSADPTRDDAVPAPIPAQVPARAQVPASGEVGEPELDPRLLSMLVCPLTRGPLRYDRAANELVSAKAGLAYRILDGIPIMLPDEARILES